MTCLQSDRALQVFLIDIQFLYVYVNMI